MDELFMVETPAAAFPEIIGKPSIKGRYHKSIKTFIQSGATITSNTSDATGLTTEIIPATNPASMKPGNTYRFTLINRGLPVVNQVVTIGQRASIFGDENITVTTTDSNGEFTASINKEEKWFMRAAQIHLRPEEEDIDYEVYIATLTFDIN